MSEEKKVSRKQLELFQIKAQVENTNERTKQMRMEAARRNVEVLFKLTLDGMSPTVYDEGVVKEGI